MTVEAPATPARYNILVSAPMLPGCCLLCRSTISPEKPAIDLGISQPRYGRLYICVDDIAEMHRAAFPPAVSKPEPQKPTVTVSEFKETVGELSNNLAGNLSMLISVLNAANVLPDNEVHSESEPGSSGFSKRATKASGQNDKLVKREGPAGLSTDTGDEPEFTLD